MVLSHLLLRDVFIFVVVVTTNKQSHVFSENTKTHEKKKAIFLMTGWCVSLEGNLSYAFINL